jgi:hypothetical protein
LLPFVGRFRLRRQQHVDRNMMRMVFTPTVFVLLPRRWVVERTFGWLGRFRRLARDYKRLSSTLEDWHWLA